MLKKRDKIEETTSSEKGESPSISPEIAVERAERRIFEESLKKSSIAGGYRKKIGDKK